MITKGIRISQLVERKDLNGKEIIPFQDGIHNGKLSIQSLIDYIGDIFDSDLELQALIKIQKFVDTVSEMDLLLYQAKEGDIYYCKENKKLYVRSFNKWDMSDPLTSKVYVLVGLDEYNRTNIIHLWDGNDMVVMSERLFIGEVTGTAYDGGKGKHLADIANSLPDNVIREVADFTTDGSTVTFNYEYDVKQESGLFDGDAQGSKTIPSATTSNAGVMSATDKVKVDKIITDGDGNKYLTDNGTYKEVQGGNVDIEFLKKYVDDSISSARSIGYMMQLTEIDASGLDENTWYPVTIAAGERKNIRVEVLVSLDSGTKPSWSTHERGFSVRKIWEFAPYASGVNSRAIFKVYLSDFSFAEIDPVRGLSDLGHFDMCYVYVRGGGKYHFYVSHEANVILHTDTYHPDDQIISPTTDIPDPIHEADWDNYGKVIDVPNGSYLTINRNVTGTEAIEFINNIFGSTDRLKEVIMDIIENHQKYLFHSYASNVNCLEVNNVYAYYEYSREEYNLQYNVSYYTNNGPVSKRTAFKLMPNNEDCVAISEDLLPDWHSIKNVLNNSNEFNFVDGEVGEQVWLNYRSRSGNTVSAGKLYIGDGQATGGFAEVHASGFFKESDIRLKSDIAPLNHTLDQICNIPTVEFDMHDKHQIGTVAQDLENNFAEIVNTDSDGMKSVDYCMLGVVAIEGIKLLRQEIEDLKKQIQELKNGK